MERAARELLSQGWLIAQELLDLLSFSGWKRCHMQSLPASSVKGEVRSTQEGEQERKSVINADKRGSGQGLLTAQAPYLDEVISDHERPLNTCCTDQLSWLWWISSWIWVHPV